MRSILMTLVVLAGSAALAAAQEAVQAPQQAPAPAESPLPERNGPGPIAESADRISRELWPLDGDAQPVFRAEVEAQYLRLQVPWAETEEERSRYAPPRGNYYHDEYLRAVTPEAFRGSTLYSAGVGVDPAVLVNGLRSAWRGWQERRIRERIAEELAELERARTAVAADQDR